MIEHKPQTDHRKAFEFFILHVEDEIENCPIPANRREAMRLLKSIRTEFPTVVARNFKAIAPLLARCVEILVILDRPRKRRPVGSKKHERQDIEIAFRAWAKLRNGTASSATMAMKQVMAQMEAEGLQITGNSEDAILRRVRGVLREYTPTFERLVLENNSG